VKVTVGLAGEIVPLAGLVAANDVTADRTMRSINKERVEPDPLTMSFTVLSSA
jgi:hypothetical protein